MIYSWLKRLFLTFALLTTTVCAEPLTVFVVGLSQDSAVLEIANTLRVLTIGQSSPEGVTLIASDSEEAILEIDGQRNTYFLSNRIRNSPSSSSQADTPLSTIVRILPDQQNMYLVDGYINLHAVNFLVDTGATHIAMSSRQAQSIGIDYQQIGKETVVATASELTKAYQIQLEKVQVGTISLYALDALVIEGNQPERILLGMNFLNQLDVHREGGILELRQ